MSTFVINQWPYWGKGSTLEEAKRNYSNAGGRLSEGYTVQEFEGEFHNPDGAGRYTYTGPDPVETVVPPRRRRK